MPTNISKRDDQSLASLAKLAIVNVDDAKLFIELLEFEDDNYLNQALWSLVDLSGGLTVKELIEKKSKIPKGNETNQFVKWLSTYSN